MSVEDAVLNAIEENQDQLYEILKTLIRFPTENPPGREGPAQEWLADRLEPIADVLDVFEVMPGRSNVAGIVKGAGTGRSVILNGHMDVVAAKKRESWQFDPFEGAESEGFIYGRGASDMKSAMAGYLFVLETLKRMEIGLNGDVTLLSVVGEEKAEPGTKMAAERYSADFAIIGEGTRARQIVASVGTLTAKITVKSPYTLHLHARRQAIHAGGGIEGANAIEKMALRIIPALNDLEREWSVFKNYWGIPPGQTLINPFLIQGGGDAGYLPDECSMYVVVVYLPDEDPGTVKQDVEDQILRAAGADGWLRKHPPRIDWNPSDQHWVFPAAELDVHHPGVQHLGRIIEDVAGCQVELGGRGGITDAGWFPINGTPSAVYGPGDVFYAHRIDERVKKEDVLLYSKVIGRFLLQWCGVS